MHNYFTLTLSNDQNPTKPHHRPFEQSLSLFCAKCEFLFFSQELHLGHLAKSFALRDPPSKITGIGKGKGGKGGGEAETGHWVRSDERKRREKKREEGVIK